MFTDPLLTQIDEYIDDADNRYAIALVGDWGSGKTHFVNTTLRQHLKKSRGKRLCRVSLFGIRSASELYERLATTDLHLNADKDSRLKRTGALAVQAGARTLSSATVSVLGKFNVDISVGAQAVTAILGRKTVIVFDDCERVSDKSVDIDLLGAINNLVEGIDCKVILISKDISRIDSNLREKVIWKTLRYSPNPEELFDAVLADQLRGNIAHKESFIDACRTGASQAKCNNARAMIKSNKLLRMILSSPILSNKQFTDAEKTRVVADCTKQTFLKCMGEPSTTPSGACDSILQPFAFEKYCQTSLIDKFFDDPQGLCQEEVDALLTSYFTYCFPLTQSDRQLRELINRRTELMYMDDAEVKEISSSLSEHLQTQIVNDPNLLCDALALNLILSDIGFNQALTAEDALIAAKNSIDSRPNEFLTALGTELEIQQSICSDCEQAKLLQQLVDYCKAKQTDTLITGIRKKLDSAAASAKGTVLFQELTRNGADGIEIIFDFSALDVATYFEKGDAQSQANLINLMNRLVEKTPLAHDKHAWLEELKEALNESVISSLMGQRRLAVIQDAIKKIASRSKVEDPNTSSVESE